ncbi:O-antigen ligase family protein [Oscillatoria sp. FACHB-1407]|uniref:O-antigen ligase family protein n=1 Tax=Oscillatoria sp. FACHB-1407 TaxID=2692847 RepID=UPI0016877EFC|nr:O-antigen ligase family protein [Oscillatoria sp. FACHB-1407]MBD2462791.1 O-antigen ligase family protein [Oscillatoria sp. FACHB-1407]
MEQYNRTEKFYDAILRFSLWTLPYFYYASFCGVFAVVIHALRTSQKRVLDSFTRNSLLLISGLLILSSAFAWNRGEAFLQLANFLPFFLVFAALTVVLKRVETLETLALGLVISAVPINLISLVEYGLKSPFLPQAMQNIGAIAQLRSAPHVGRAMVTFDHPNVLASYLVMVLGLGLGLVIKQLAQPLQKPSEIQSQIQSHPDTKPRLDWSVWRSRLLYIGTGLNLVGIFCSGSRNGLIIAISQLIVFALLARTRRMMFLAGLLGVGAIALAVLTLGVGGRSVTEEAVATDPRVGVWQIALDLIRERPLLGWGLGNYKLIYPERLIDPTHPYIAHPHNIWLLLGSEAGIPAMLLMTVLVGYICYRAVRLLLLQKTAPISPGIVLAYLLAFWGCIGFALFDVTLYDAGINIMNWTMLAGIYSASLPDPSPSEA